GRDTSRSSDGSVCVNKCQQAQDTFENVSCGFFPARFSHSAFKPLLIQEVTSGFLGRGGLKIDGICSTGILPVPPLKNTGETPVLQMPSILYPLFPFNQIRGFEGNSNASNPGST